MKKQDLIVALQNELERTYHNATLHNTLTADSDYEADLAQSQLEHECEVALSDIKYTCPEILQYGSVYQWGRGGRTVAPEGLVKRRGGSMFRIKSVDDLNMTYLEQRRLLKVLKSFNDYVESFCKTAPDETLRFIREEYSEQIKENTGKKRQHYSGVRYV